MFEVCQKYDYVKLNASLLPESLHFTMFLPNKYHFILSNVLRAIFDEVIVRHLV